MLNNLIIVNYLITESTQEQLDKWILKSISRFNRKDLTQYQELELNDDGFVTLYKIEDNEWIKEIIINLDLIDKRKDRVINDVENFLKIEKRNKTICRLKRQRLNNYVGTNNNK